MITLILFAMGKSMLPTLRRITFFIIIKKLGSYNKGDIICLKTHDKKYHIHRIINYNFVNELVSTKGDNLEQQDYEIDVPFKNIRGKLIWSL